MSYIALYSSTHTERKWKKIHLHNPYQQQYQTSLSLCTGESNIPVNFGLYLVRFESFSKIKPNEPSVSWFLDVKQNHIYLHKTDYSKINLFPLTAERLAPLLNYNNNVTLPNTMWLANRKPHKELISCAWSEDTKEVTSLHWKHCTCQTALPGCQINRVPFLCSQRQQGSDIKLKHLQ